MDLLVQTNERKPLAIVVQDHTVTLAARNSDHSFSPQELEISFAMRPSHRTVGETWIPFWRENLTI
jgi:hypothetical protein